MLALEQSTLEHVFKTVYLIHLNVLHFHKLTTELFNSIKTQQINVFNASVDTNAYSLCHILEAIKSAGLQSAVMLNRGLGVAGQ